MSCAHSLAVKKAKGFACVSQPLSRKCPKTLGQNQGSSPKSLAGAWRNHKDPLVRHRARAQARHAFRCRAGHARPDFPRRS